MAQFIRVTRISGRVIRINVEHIVAYHAQDLKGGDGEGPFPGSDIQAVNEISVWVKETPEEIDRLLNPGYTA